MDSVPMLAACARHQLLPNLEQWALWKRRCEARYTPRPNLMIRTYADGDPDSDGVDQAVLTFKEG